MRVEQRIGRIDRVGQRYPKIRIVNLQYDDTIETAVYRVFQERIGFFTSVVGKLQPILSSVSQRIAAAVLGTPALSDEISLQPELNKILQQQTRQHSIWTVWWYRS